MHTTRSTPPSIIVDSKKETIHRVRDAQTWTFAGTYPRFYRRLCAEYGDEAVSHAMSEGDYYPPILDACERLDLEDAAQRIQLAPLLD